MFKRRLITADQASVFMAMTFEQRSSSLVLHQMMSDHNSSDLAPQRQEMSVENVSSGLVPQGQKASDYDNSDPVPPRQNVVPTAEKTDSSQQGFKYKIKKTENFQKESSRHVSWKSITFTCLEMSINIDTVVRLGINPMIQPEPEDLPKDNPKLEIAVLRWQSAQASEY
ncbi:hypothetical protein Tco_0537901 [Tanacetum coccineum]